MAEVRDHFRVRQCVPLNERQDIIEAQDVEDRAQLQAAVSYP